MVTAFSFQYNMDNMDNMDSMDNMDNMECGACKKWELEADSMETCCETLIWAIGKLLKTNSVYVDAGDANSLAKIMDDLNKKPVNIDLDEGCEGIECMECEEQLDKPVVLQCGHVVCLSCVDPTGELMGSCPKCLTKITNVFPVFL